MSTNRKCIRCDMHSMLCVCVCVWNKTLYKFNTLILSGIHSTRKHIHYTKKEEDASLRYVRAHARV